MSDSGDLVRRITISATGEGIDSTTDSVNGLGDAFDNVSKKSQDSFTNLALGIAGSGAGVIGVLAGMRAFVDYAGEQSKALADTCACRKSNPNIFVVQSAEDWAAENTPCPLHGAR
jgi:hypothetical protein